MSTNPNRLSKRVFVVTVIVIVFVTLVLLFSENARTLIGLRSSPSYPFPGSQAQFDPVAAYPEVAKIAGSRGKLNTIEAKYVQPNGTLNLNAEYHPSVRYSFVENTSEKTT